MAEGKWISGLSASTPVAEAARQTLTVRLEVVRRYLKLALDETNNDPEPVHQLRVGTRRARAALDIFAAYLPGKVAKRARKQLRRLRRVAGEARDWDVFRLTLMSQRRPAAQRPGFDFLIGYALAQRSVAQGHLEAAAAELDLDRFTSEVVPAVCEPASHGEIQTLASLARPMLHALLKVLESAAAADLEDYENLHQLRIAGKRLRYAMEVFASCFPPPFRTRLYPAVEEMQEILGLANDSHVATQRIRALRDKARTAAPAEWRRWKAGVEAVLRFHQRRLPQQRRKFLAWWKRWRTSGQEAEFVALLKE